jgi:ELWxxDGT repeat protein
MRAFSGVWTALAALVFGLAATVGAGAGEQGTPDTQAFLVKDINNTFAAAAGSSPGPFVEAGGFVFFSATDGTNSGLWRTDGTPAGTVMVKAIGVRDLTNVNGTLFFHSDFSPFSTRMGDKLWRSDGTAEGTVLVRTTSARRRPSTEVLDSSPPWAALCTS